MGLFRSKAARKEARANRQQNRRERRNARLERIKVRQQAKSDRTQMRQAAKVAQSENQAEADKVAYQNGVEPVEHKSTGAGIAGGVGAFVGGLFNRNKNNSDDGYDNSFGGRVMNGLDNVLGLQQNQNPYGYPYDMQQPKKASLFDNPMSIFLLVGLAIAALAMIGKGGKSRRYAR